MEFRGNGLEIEFGRRTEVPGVSIEDVIAGRRERDPALRIYEGVTVKLVDVEEVSGGNLREGLRRRRKERRGGERNEGEGRGEEGAARGGQRGANDLQGIKRGRGHLYEPERQNGDLM